MSLIKVYYILIVIICCNGTYLYPKQNNIDNKIQDISVIKSLFEKGLKHYNSSPDSSLFYTHKAFGLAKKYNNYEYIAKCENLLAVVYTNTGNYNKAIEHYIHSIKIFEKLNNVNGLIMTFTNLGTLNRLQKRYDKAFEYYLKAFNISKKFTNKIDKNLIPQIYANIGILFDDLKKYDKAIKFYNKALSIYKMTGDKGGIAYCYNSTAISYINLRNIDKSQYNTTETYLKANQLYLKALNLFEEINNQYGMATVLVNLSNSNIKLKNYKQAIIYSHKTLEIAQKTGALTTQSVAYENLSISYDSINDSPKAYYYYKLFKQIDDSLFNIEKKKQINELQLKYESSKKEKEINDKNTRIIVLEQIKKTDKLKKNILTGGIISVLILSFIYIKGLKRRIKLNRQLFENKKLLNEKELENEKLKSLQLQKELELRESEIMYKNKEIEYKNKELVNFALSIAEKNELLEEIKDTLINNKEPAMSSKTIQIISRNQINLDEERRELHSKIELINQSFYMKLHEILPEITNTEEKLCALIRLKLSSKQIALTLNITPQSVDVYKNRLRKKFNLNKHVNLNDFLNSL